MNDIKKFQEQLEQTTDLLNKFPSFFKSFEKLARQTSHVSKERCRERGKRS